MDTLGNYPWYTHIGSLACEVTVIIVRKAKWKPLKSHLPPLAETVNPNHCFISGEIVEAQKKLRNAEVVVPSYAHVIHQFRPCNPRQILEDSCKLNQVVALIAAVMLDVVFLLEQITWPQAHGMEPWIRKMCSFPFLPGRRTRSVLCSRMF